MPTLMTIRREPATEPESLSLHLHQDCRLRSSHSYPPQKSGSKGTWGLQLATLRWENGRSVHRFACGGSGRALWPVRDLWRLSVAAGVAAPQSIRNFPVGKTRRMCQQLSKSILERCHDYLSPINSTFRIASTASSICRPVHRPALATSGRLDVPNQRNAKQMQSHRMITSPFMEKGAIPVS